MNRKRALLGLALATSFLLGGVVGGALVFLRTVPQTAAMVALGDRAQAGENAYVRYRYASYGVAKDALLGYARKLEGPASAVLGPKMTDFDLGLTYGRLAMLAERSGQAADAATYMSQAIQAFGRHDEKIDEAWVRRAIQRLDAAWDQRLAGSVR
jgi:hypothetical protein